MSQPYDWNELDRAIFALGRSKAAMPEVFRALSQGELCALMPYHPELEGEALQIKNGMKCPFIMVEEKEGTTVALFSSEARAEEGMKKGGIPENKFAVGAMPAKQMLEVIGKMNVRASVNKGCATGAFFMDAELMLALWDGSALKPREAGPTEEQTVNLMDPADYPTEMIQPLFETLRRHPSFRAAWVTTRTQATPGGGLHYQFLLLAQPRDDAATHDFNLVLQQVRKGPDEVSFGFVDKEGETGRELLERAIPFYAAPDFTGARSLIDPE